MTGKSIGGLATAAIVLIALVCMIGPSQALAPYMEQIRTSWLVVSPGRLGSNSKVVIESGVPVTLPSDTIAGGAIKPSTIPASKLMPSSLPGAVMSPGAVTNTQVGASPRIDGDKVDPTFDASPGQAVTAYNFKVIPSAGASPVAGYTGLASTRNAAGDGQCDYTVKAGLIISASPAACASP